MAWRACERASEAAGASALAGCLKRTSKRWRGVGGVRGLVESGGEVKDGAARRGSGGRVARRGAPASGVLPRGPNRDLDRVILLGLGEQRSEGRAAAA